MVVGWLATAVHAAITFEDEIKFTAVIVEGRRSESFVCGSVEISLDVVWVIQLMYS
jgi:hypothetical protein